MNDTKQLKKLRRVDAAYKIITSRNIRSKTENTFLESEQKVDLKRVQNEDKQQQLLDEE